MRSVLVMVNKYDDDEGADGCVANYMPISLKRRSPIFSKIRERVIAKNMLDHVSQNALLHIANFLIAILIDLMPAGPKQQTRHSGLQRSTDRQTDTDGL